jgi:hypothetical protein
MQLSLFLLLSNNGFLFLVAAFACLSLRLVLLTLALIFLPIEKALGGCLVVGKECQATHVRLQNLWDLDTLGSLVVLHNTAHCAFSGAHRSIQHVDILLLLNVSLGIAHFEGSRLVVSAIRTADELSKSSIAREPSFKIILHCRCIVKCTRRNIDHLVGQVESLIEFL